jgi:hypothetical protein
MSEIDTVGSKFYKPLQTSEKIGDFLFWIISTLSIAVLFIDKVTHAFLLDTLKIALIVLTIAFFLQGQIHKLYFFPRAEDRRRQDLLSNSFGVTLIHEGTVGYYNNDQINSMKRLAASVMESAFFTSEISRAMLVGQRAKTLGYLAIYVIALLNRSTDLELLAVAAQALFGGEIIAKWLRMEWLRMRSEQTFDNLNRLFNSRPAFTRSAAQSEALNLFSFYETAKSTAAILLSSKIFHKKNVKLTQEWEKIRSSVGL